MINMKCMIKKSILKPMIQMVQTTLHNIHLYNHRKYWKLPERTRDECIVIGNGPSLSQSLEKIYKYPADVYTVNDVCCTDFFLKLSPIAHFFLDPLYFNDAVHSKIEPNFSFPDHVRKVHYYFKQAQQRCNLMVPTTLVPLARMQYKEIEKVLGFAMDPCAVEVVRSVKRIEKGYCGISGVNSVIPAIQTACLAGYKKIWLAGIDMTCFTFCVDENCRIQRENRHFYTSTVANTGRWSSVANFYRDIAKVFDAFDQLRDLALCRNVQIVNTSLQSMVQSFPKGNLGEEPYEWLANGYK